MEEKRIYIPYKLSGFERTMFCDYCDSHLNKFEEVYCKFYQDEKGNLWFEEIICPHCFHPDAGTEDISVEVISFFEAKDVFKKSILKSVLAF